MDFEDRFFSAEDGLKLHARIYEPVKELGGTVVCLPGLTRNRRDFHDLALHLSRKTAMHYRVICMDYRGRGRSEYDPDFTHYNVITEAEDVLTGLAALGVEHADFIGTSRGGIIIHFLAAMRPSLLKSIVLNDIGPVIEGSGLMQIKAYLGRGPKPKDWTDAINIQKTLHAREFPALTNRDWEIHAKALYRETEHGAVVADYDPELIKTLVSIDPAVPLATIWTQFEGLGRHRLMTIRGENSKLLSKSTVDEMAKRHPKMQLVTVLGQGHAPMLWTAELPEKIAAFLG